MLAFALTNPTPLNTNPCILCSIKPNTCSTLSITFKIRSNTVCPIKVYFYPYPMDFSIKKKRLFGWFRPESALFLKGQFFFSRL